MAERGSEGGSAPRATEETLEALHERIRVLETRLDALGEELDWRLGRTYSRLMERIADLEDAFRRARWEDHGRW